MPSAGSQKESERPAPMRMSFAIALIAATLASMAVAGPLDDASVAYARGDYETALRIRLELANQGDPMAQVLLGLMYAGGHGVPRDDVQAVQWYRRAAEQNFAWGQNNLGVMYKYGRGLEKNDTEAVKWYRKAADQGNAMAQDNLGVMYRDGRGVDMDEAAAVSWFRKAAEKGYAEGENNLGFMYESGRGVAKDDNEAAQWYRRAADQGNALAQKNLGRISRKGNVAFDASKCNLVQIDQWRVRFARNRLLVIEGAINSQKTGILLDTGATRTMIFRPVAERLGLVMRPLRNVYMSGFGGISFAESAHVGEFRIGESTRRNWYMMVAGERDPGDGVGVILGEDFFQNVDVEFDLANRAVRLFQPRNCNGASLAYWTSEGVQEVEIEKFDSERPRIVVPVKVNGNPIDALFDTGASASILDRKTAGRLGVRPDSPGVVAAGKVGGIGQEWTETWVGPFESFEIGDEAIKTTSIPFGDVPTGTKMILGMDFIFAHRLLISHSQRKIYFTYAGGPVFQRASDSQRGKD